jgi:hypothetical protein
MAHCHLPSAGMSNWSWNHSSFPPAVNATETHRPLMDHLTATQCVGAKSLPQHRNSQHRRQHRIEHWGITISNVRHKLSDCATVRERRDGALALSDLRLLLNQPPGKLGGSYFCFLTVQCRPLHSVSGPPMLSPLVAAAMRLQLQRTDRRSYHASHTGNTTNLRSALTQHVSSSPRCRLCDWNNMMAADSGMSHCTLTQCQYGPGRCLQAGPDCAFIHGLQEMSPGKDIWWYSARWVCLLHLACIEILRCRCYRPASLLHKLLDATSMPLSILICNTLRTFINTFYWRYMWRAHG